MMKTQASHSIRATRTSGRVPAKTGSTDSGLRPTKLHWQRLLAPFGVDVMLGVPVQAGLARNLQPRAEDTVDAAGTRRRTISGVYGDIGIFNFTDTAYRSWQRYPGDADQIDRTIGAAPVIAGQAINDIGVVPRWVTTGPNTARRTPATTTAFKQSQPL